jgi:hypothetical protein
LIGLDWRNAHTHLEWLMVASSHLLVPSPLWTISLTRESVKECSSQWETLSFMQNLFKIIAFIVRYSLKCGSFRQNFKINHCTFFVKVLGRSLINLGASDSCGKRYPEKNVQAFFVCAISRGGPALISLLQVCRFFYIFGLYVSSSISSRSI